MIEPPAVVDDLRSVIEKALKLARDAKEPKVEDLLLMALLSLRPRGFREEDAFRPPPDTN